MKNLMIIAASGFVALTLTACGGEGGGNTDAAKQALMTACLDEGQTREGCTCLIAELDKAKFTAAQIEAAQGGFLPGYEPGEAIKADPAKEGQYRAAMSTCDTDS